MAIHLRAAFCGSCGAYVPQDVLHCPACHTAAIPHDVAELLTGQHPDNSQASIWRHAGGERCARCGSALPRRAKVCPGCKHPRRGAGLGRPALPAHCPWCGAKVRWGEDRDHPGHWVGCDRTSVSGYAWRFGLPPFNRDRVKRGGGPWRQHECCAAAVGTYDDGPEEFSGPLSLFYAAGHDADRKPLDAPARPGALENAANWLVFVLVLAGIAAAAYAYQEWGTEDRPPAPASDGRAGPNDDDWPVPHEDPDSPDCVRGGC
jgi:RNA polymerase subunit RPABC4/transcription elongation factor Spt4